jgi:3D (Asp-Asp-Asp) domain-containing protein
MLAVMLPLVTLASESPNTEIKTKINFNTIANFFFPEAAKADENTEVVTEEVVVEAPVKTEEEIKNEAILAKWKVKQTAKWENLPKGEFTINASAYTAAADECDNDLGVTASGIKVQEKRTIACPPEFPFGAKINIEGQGTFTCEDRGGAIKGNHIDIYVKTKAEAFAFGRQNLVAKVVE